MKQIAFLLGLILAASCVQENTQFQASLLGDELDHILQSSRIGRAILKMTELRSSIREVDFSRLFGALDDLASSINDRKTEEADQLEHDYQAFLSDNDFYQNQVTEFQTQVSQHQVDLQALKTSRQQLEATLRNSGDQVAQKQRQLQQLELAMTKADKVFTSQSGEYDKAISVVDKALEQMSKVSAGSFIEVSREEVTTIANVMQKRLSEITQKVIFFEPLVDSLIQLAETKFSDQESVQKVVKLLQKLRDEMVSSKQALQGAYESQSHDNQELVQEYVQLIENLSTNVIPELQTDIEVKNGQIKAKQELFDDAAENLSTAADNLDNTNARWTARQAQNKALVDEYNNELQAIAASLAALERGGIRRP